MVYLYPPLNPRFMDKITFLCQYAEKTILDCLVYEYIKPNDLPEHIKNIDTSQKGGREELVCGLSCICFKVLFS